MCYNTNKLSSSFRLLGGLFFKPIKYQKIKKQAIILTIVRIVTLAEFTMTGDVHYGTRLADY